ncbi:DNA (cytosine-5-)-methyltransferase [Agrobacterium vitis]|uniref:DNA (cytosine-5-)-methyltransferase n=1 Tax=Agrobacterium vitis TaxID=373 RepID=A0A7J4X4U3_AGRVI|nr:DNA cytosine methyltransferase [Agrobacterium vitis]KAA3527074.1 DNA (cytosine-5-)-methyltransferase [Agrobacterium vitis]MUZ95925.1 DNA (cytosine-5-)-methyltransferase [Agrobacterium vitis]
MKYASVCSGIEAATVAFHPLGWEPAFFSEIEAFPSAVLAHHYGSNMPGEPLSRNGVPNLGDFAQITDEQIRQLGPVDALIGGTPCQSFSVAGKRLGLDDPRGNLALEYLRLACRLRARWFLWENVPGVLSSVSDEEDGEGGILPGLEGREAGDEWTEESDFATFLSFVRECGYGFAYRVFDAQYVRVAGFERAVPQRRRRVFVVGYFGDWRRAAAILLEPEGMRGDSAPRRKPGKSVAPTIASRPSGGGGLGTDFDLDGGLIHCRDGACAITSNYGKQPDSSDTALGPNVVAQAFEGFSASGDGYWREGVGPLRAREQDSHESVIAQAFGGNNLSGPIDVATALSAHGGPAGRMDFESETFVAHTLRGEGFDVSEDGTGRGTPIVPIAFDCKASGRNGFSVGEIAPTLRSMGHLDSHQNAGGQVAVQQGWAVRRLLPKECERLQGFDDDYTNVPWRGKPTSPDGPRYKALGNSMAVNVMRHIGTRIDMMERLIAEGRV